MVKGEVKRYGTMVVQDGMDVSIPKRIMEAWGNPKQLRFDFVDGKMIVGPVEYTADPVETK